MVNPEIVHYTPHALIGVAVSWLCKMLYDVVKTEWSEVKGKLSIIESTTRTQAENHLFTIQSNTSKTNDLLEKVVEGQAEMNGFLRGRLG